MSAQMVLVLYTLFFSILHQKNCYHFIYHQYTFIPPRRHCQNLTTIFFWFPARNGHALGWYSLTWNHQTDVSCQSCRSRVLQDRYQWWYRTGRWHRNYFRRSCGRHPSTTPRISTYSFVIYYQYLNIITVVR